VKISETTIETDKNNNNTTKKSKSFKKRGPYSLKDRGLSESDKLVNNFFKQKRLELNKNLEEMAHFLNISSRLYWRLENEEITATKKIMDKIGTGLNIDPVAIFFPLHKCNDCCNKDDCVNWQTDNF